jgi:predicted nucleotidyltransferase
MADDGAEPVTTLGERKAAEAARRKAAADAAVADLRAYAREHGGRFVVFGSYLTGGIRFDSDLDVVVDFPADRVAEAWRFAEEVCARRGLAPDLHDAATTTRPFLERVRAKGVVLP